jgi:hypothetical protein
VHFTFSLHLGGVYTDRRISDILRSLGFDWDLAFRAHFQLQKRIESLPAHFGLAHYRLRSVIGARIRQFGSIRECDRFMLENLFPRLILSRDSLKKSSGP